jgi:hypothetical protein
MELDVLDGLHQRLFQYIQDYHPYKIDDDRQETIDFIVLRSQSAHGEYSRATLEGKNGLECEEAALKVLYAGLHFSPITYLIEAYVDLYGTELEKQEACQIYKNPMVRDIFERYGDNIEGAPDEYLLREELTSFMEQYKLEHP